MGLSVAHVERAVERAVKRGQYHARGEFIKLMACTGAIRLRGA